MAVTSHSPVVYPLVHHAVGHVDGERDAQRLQHTGAAPAQRLPVAPVEHAQGSAEAKDGSCSKGTGSKVASGVFD